MEDPIGKALGLSPHEIDLEGLFEKYGMKIYDKNMAREEAIARNTEMVGCDRCGVIGNRPNMMRWHFENCKTKLKKCVLCGETIPRQGIKDYLYKQKKYCNSDCYNRSKIGKAPFIMTEEIKNKLRKPKSEEHKKKLSEAKKRYYGCIKSRKDR